MILRSFSQTHFLLFLQLWQLPGEDEGTWLPW